MNEKSKDKELNFANQPQVSLVKKNSVMYIFVLDYYHIYNSNGLIIKVTMQSIN